MKLLTVARDVHARRAKRGSLFHMSREFELGGVRVPGFPCPLNSKGGIILPAADYLTERAVNQKVNIGTVTQEAYVLKEWFDFCEANQRSWEEPDDEFFRSWRTALEKRRVGRRVEDPEAWSRNNRMMAIVRRFYSEMQTVLHAFDRCVISDLGRDGGEERPLTIILSTPGKDGSKPVALTRVRYGNRPENLTGRPTPRPAEVEQVLSVVADRESDFASSTHYLMARSMAQAGLRACGCSNVSVMAIARGLLQEGIGDRPGAKAQALDLHAVGRDPKRRAGVIGAIDALAARYRKHVFVLVTEKRQVTRAVAMPLALLRELLEYVWDDRTRFVEGRQARCDNFVPGQEVFLSAKTGKGYRPGSISNVLGVAFGKAGVAGSGHRLRAAYAEEVVRDAYFRARAAHGRNYDPMAVLLLAREVLGHKSFKAIKAYLNQIMVEENLLPGQPVLVTREEHAPAVRALVDALNEGHPDGPRLLAGILLAMGCKERHEDRTMADMKASLARRRAGLKAISAEDRAGASGALPGAVPTIGGTAGLPPAQVAL